MKNQRKIYEALLAGETLIKSYPLIAEKVKLDKRDELIDADTGKLVSKTFNNYADWEIYKEPKWYDNTPDGGVLCWIKGDIFLIYNNSPFANLATPLTKQEIQVFMDNAPEDL